MGRSLEILAAIGMENDPIVVNTTWPQAIMLMDLVISRSNHPCI